MMTIVRSNPPGDAQRSIADEQASRFHAGFLWLSGPLELLEPDRQPLPIGIVLTSPRRLDHLPGDPFQPEFEKRPIMDFEQPVGDVNPVIGVDPD
jgi:hypothetical protein